MTVQLSESTFFTAGVLLLTLVTLESGGLYMLALIRGRRTATQFQVTFVRAGHARAGVLVILSLIAQLYVDAAVLSGLMGAVARNGVPLVAILMPAGCLVPRLRVVARPWLALSFQQRLQGRKGGPHLTS